MSAIIFWNSSNLSNEILQGMRYVKWSETKARLDWSNHQSHSKDDWIKLVRKCRRWIDLELVHGGLLIKIELKWWIEIQILKRFESELSLRVSTLNGFRTRGEIICWNRRIFWNPLKRMIKLKNVKLSLKR